MTVDEALQYIRNARDADRLAQAYIVEGGLHGEAGELTDRIVSLLFCTGDGSPCGTCRPCLQVRERTHPDVLWVEPHKKSRIISIGQVRDLRSRILQTAFQGGWKAAVLVGADRLGPGASNAFLKVLEEPPARSLFVLPTDAPQFLLPTVVSRCQRVAVGRNAIRLPPAWRERLVAILSGAAADAWPVTDAQCRTARLRKLLEEVKKTAVEHEAEAAEEETVEETDETLEARILARYREFRAGIMRAMLGWHRDMLVLLCGRGADLLYFPDQVETLQRAAAGLSLRQCVANLRLVETMYRQLEQNVPEHLVLADGVLRMASR